MDQVRLHCPHCNGAFSLSDRPISKTVWHCPYCGKESVLNRSDTGIQIEGVLLGNTNISSDLPHDAVDTKGSPPRAEPAERPLTDYIAEINQPVETVAKLKEAVVETNKESLQALLAELGRSAASCDLPLFNSLSRKILEQDPYAGHVYLERTLLIERADGFARNIWATPVWYLYTPKQKTTRLRQHLYNLNTALQYLEPSAGRDLCTKTGHLLVRQAVDHLTEKAQLRCSHRLFAKTFKGRFRRKDLSEARDFCDAVSLIQADVCPGGHIALRAAIRECASGLQPKLARALTRF